MKGGFWNKTKSVARKVPFIPEAVGAYYCMLDSKTPVWAKAMVIGALTYFISPVDAIPDPIIAIGLTDDAAVIAAAISLQFETISQMNTESKLKNSLRMKHDKMEDIKFYILGIGLLGVILLPIIFKIYVAYSNY